MTPACLDVAGEAVELAERSQKSQRLFLPFDQVGEIASNITSSIGVLQLGRVITQGIQNTPPNCNAEFTGTILAHANIAGNMGIQRTTGDLAREP
jgi:hypothetical protein